MFMLGDSLREAAKKKFNKNDMPTTIFASYLVCQHPTDNLGPWVIGYDNLGLGLKVQGEMMSKGFKAEILIGDYPYEVMEMWKEKKNK